MKKLILITLLIILTFNGSILYADCPTVTSYTIYYGTASRVYTNSISGITTTSYTITSLPTNTYYFAVTATDSNGQSGYSNEGSSYVTGTITASWIAPTLCSDGSSIDLASGVTGTINVTGIVAGGNGTISCTTPAQYGSTVACTTTPDIDYYTSTIRGCGGSWSSGNNYITGALTINCNVTAQFYLSPQYTVSTAVLGGNESLSNGDGNGTGSGSNGSGSGSDPAAVPVGYSPQWLVVTLLSLLAAGGYLLRKKNKA